MELFVDDNCTIMVNGNSISKKFIGGGENKFESDINLSGGINIFEFEVENITGANGLDNPYGLVYIITILISE